jgi:hypothetical protein
MGMAGDLASPKRTFFPNTAGDFKGRFAGDLTLSNRTPLRILSGAGRREPRLRSGIDFTGLYGSGHNFGALYPSIDLIEAVSGSSSMGVQTSDSVRTFHFPVCDVGLFRLSGAGFRFGTSGRCPGNRLKRGAGGGSKTDVVVFNSKVPISSSNDSF